MHATREMLAGWSAFAAFFACAIALGAYSGSATLRAFSLIAGLGGGGAIGVFAALFAHILGRPMGYEPVPGDAGAWGFAEVEGDPQISRRE